MNRSSQQQFEKYPAFGDRVPHFGQDEEPSYVPSPFSAKFTRANNFPRQSSTKVNNSRDENVTIEYENSWSAGCSSCTCCNTNWDIPRKVFAEFMGTVVLIYVGCMGCSPYSFGFALVLSAHIFGHISGGHYNPAVSIAALIMGEMEYIKFPFYLIAQFAGAFLGYLLSNINYEASKTECETVIAMVSIEEALIIEIFSTCFLVMACCSFWDKNNPNNDGTGPIKAGLLLIGLCLGAAPYTGASFNTARSLPPAAIHSKWDDHWVYWVGPNVGGVLAALIYRFLLRKSHND